MATVEELLRASLGEILVQPVETGIEASDAKDFIFSLNNYMSRLAIVGINLGYTTVANLYDVLTVPDGALEAISYNMALRSADKYGAQVTTSLAQKAAQGERDLRYIARKLPLTQYPSTLPIGTGNQFPGQYSYGYNFYPGVRTAVLNEQSSNISVETDTDDLVEGDGNAS